MKGVLVHEVLHLTNLHHVRTGNRDVKLWNEACDYSVNPSIVKSGFVLPKGALMNDSFANMSAEDIYRILYQQQQNQQQNKNQNNKNSNNNNSGNGSPSNNNSNSSNNNSNSPSNNKANGNNPANGNGSSGSGSSGNPSNIGGVKKAKGKSSSQMEEITKCQIARAEMAQKNFANGSVGAALKEAMKKRGVNIDWTEIVNRFINEIYPIDYSWTNPNRRYLSQGIVLPSITGKVVSGFAIAIDTSGSVSTEELNRMVSVTLQALGTVQETNASFDLPIIFCDDKVRKIQVVDSPDSKIESVGGGGTSFKPVFDCIKEDKEGLFTNLKGLIYITDGHCSLEKIEEPPFPVLWAITTKGGIDYFKRPFGEDMYFDINQ